MKLRSGKKINIDRYFKEENKPFKMIMLPLKIDFDESSKEWRKNKISLGEGMFKYKNKY